jgi:hypothetical protein
MHCVTKRSYGVLGLGLCGPHRRRTAGGRQCDAFISELFAQPERAGSVHLYGLRSGFDGRPRLHGNDVRPNRRSGKRPFDEQHGPRVREAGRNHYNFARTPGPRAVRRLVACEHRSSAGHECRDRNHRDSRGRRRQPYRRACPLRESGDVDDKRRHERSALEDDTHLTGRLSTRAANCTSRLRLRAASSA